MTDNPYRAPSPVADKPTIETPKRRPIGIAIVAVLHVVGGLLVGSLVGYLAVLLWNESNVSTTSRIVFIVGPLMAMLSFATAVGLWHGHKWAWWLATLYYFQYAFFGAFAISIMLVAFLLQDISVAERTLRLVGNNTVGILVCSFLSFYMTRRAVLAYFQFTWLTRLRALTIMMGALSTISALVGSLIFVRHFVLPG